MRNEKNDKKRHKRRRRTRREKSKKDRKLLLNPQRIYIKSYQNAMRYSEKGEILLKSYL